MKLKYKGSDIFDKISVNYCVHEMYSGDQSDCIKIKFNDPHGLWSKWQPSQREIIEFENGTSKTGKMYIHSLKPTNGQFELNAMSMPLTGLELKNKSWETIRLKQLAKEIASNHNLDFESYDCDDHLYQYLAQKNESDFEYLNRRCTYEGYQMIIYDSKLIIYNESIYDTLTPTKTIEIGIDGFYEFNHDISCYYSACKISSGQYSGIFTDPATENKRVLNIIGSINATSKLEADRFAKACLRATNKYEYTGFFKQQLLLDLAPAAVIKLKVLKASEWDGSMFISKIRHDHLKNSTKVFFRRTLEGY